MSGRAAVLRGGSRIRSLPGGPDPVLLAERELGVGQALAIAFLLILLDLSQHGRQALVGDDVSLLDSGL